MEMEWILVANDVKEDKKVDHALCNITDNILIL